MAKFNPGTYEGSGRGYGGKLFASVTVSEDRIEQVKITQHKEYRGIGWGLSHGGSGGGGDIVDGHMGQHGLHGGHVSIGSGIGIGTIAWGKGYHGVAVEMCTTIEQSNAEGGAHTEFRLHG